MKELPRTVRLLTTTVGVVIAVSFVAGIGAAVLGRSLTDLGKGYGGLWGWPATLLTLLALILGVAATYKIARKLGPEEHRLRTAVLVLVGVWGGGYWLRRGSSSPRSVCDRMVGRQHPNRFSAFCVNGSAPS